MSRGHRHGALDWLLALSNASVTWFYPEEYTLGVPRGMPDIHGGDGHDVLDGRDHHETDWFRGYFQV